MPTTMTNPTQLLPAPGKEFNDAKRLYMEQYGSALVRETYYRLALLAVSFVAVAATFAYVKTLNAATHPKREVVRIDEIGRAQAVGYNPFDYSPQAREVRYFLTQFVHDYYSRLHATVRDDFAKSMYFLEPKLADGIMQQSKKSKDIENFLVGGNDDIDIQVRNVSVPDLRTPPYRATVDFDKIYYAYGQARQETHRERYEASFVFTFKDEVPNSIIPVNPLGLSIQYFREDQTFQNPKANQ